MTIHSLINFFTGTSHLFWITFVACSTVSLMRRLLIKRWWVAACYYGVLFCLIFGLQLGNAGVLNEDYGYLETFRQIERNNQVADAENNSKDVHVRWMIGTFQSSEEFKQYIQQLDMNYGLAALFVGWLFAFIGDLAFAIAYLLRRLFKLFFKRRKIAPS